MPAEIPAILVENFLKALEEVFDLDWPHSKEMLGIQDETEAQKKEAAKLGLETIQIISADGTFLNPKVPDESEDWGNRGKLLDAYRALKRVVESSRKA